MRDNPIHTLHIREGVAARDRQPRLAIAHLTVAATATNWFQPLAKRLLAEVYRQRNEHEGASEAERYTLPWPIHSSMGALPIRLEDGYHAAMRDVARVYEIPVVDAPAEPDEDIDFCHVNAAGHARIGLQVARQLERVLPTVDRGNPRWSKGAVVRTSVP